MGMHHRTLLVFLSVDLLLIVTSIVCGLLLKMGYISNWPDILNIGRDFSFGEYFNFVKWTGIIVIFGYAFYITRDALFASLAFVFLLILADDSLQIHEQVGAAVATATSKVDAAVGEIGLWVLLGLICLGILALTWRKAKPAHKIALRPLVLLFAGLVVCGVGIDFLHSKADWGSITAGILLILEDGGEMIFISLILAYVYGTFAQPDATPVAG